MSEKQIITGRILRGAARKLAVLFFISLSLVGIFSYTRGGDDARVAAATSTYLTFQGRLFSASGSLVADGYYNLEFKLYDDDNAGSLLWTETHYDTNGATAGQDYRVRVKNGYFSVQLGSQTAFPSIDWDQQLWLTMNVGGTNQVTPSWDGEMTPRIQLTSVPYAFKSAESANVRSAATNAASTDSDDITIRTGNAAGATSNSGDITMDVGTATGTAGTINIGTANTSGITIGRTGVTTTNAGALTVSEVLSVNGNTTLGDANTDTLTINGTAVSIPNNLNFDSNTLFLDTTNNAVGIGTNSITSGFQLQVANASNVNVALTPGAGGMVSLYFDESASGVGSLTYDNSTDVLELGANGGIFTLDYSGATIGADQNLTVDTSTLFVDGTANVVAIGTTTTTAAGKLNVVGTPGGTDASLASFNGTTTGTSSTSSTYSKLSVTPGSSSTAGYSGAVNEAYLTNGNLGSGGAVMGSYNRALSQSTSAVAGSLFGGYFQSANIASGTVASAAGIVAASASNSGGGAITDNFGIYVQTQSAGTNDYGLYIQGADTYSLFVDAGDSRLDGKLSVGTGSAPTAQMEIGGATGTTKSFVVNSGTSTGSIAEFQDNGTPVFTIADGGAVTATGNISQTGSTTFSTGTGGVSLNGATTVTTGNNFTVATGLTTLGGNLLFSQGANRTLSVATQATAATAGNNLSVSAGTGNTSGAGGALNLQGGAGGTSGAGGAVTIQGGAAGGGNTNGGNVNLVGGTGAGSGVKGLVVIDTATYSTAGTQSSATSTNITQTNIDSYGAILLSATASGVTFTLSDPTITTAGRVIYVTNAGTNDFTLSVNGGGTGNTITLKPNTTATMYWNGSDWTAAGASSSTDLQAAYNNTATSAGGAELILNAPGGSADGLTIRNNGTTPITGGLLEVQTSIGSNLFTVNNNASEYASNGGAETAGGTSSTFPASTWDTTTGGTISRYITTGDYVATGQASVSMVTSAQNHGARNRISTSLTSGLTYTASFAIRGTSNFTNLEVRYSPDGTTSGTTLCGNSSYTVTTGQWTRIDCNFTASGTITSSNSMLIRYIGVSGFPTFYIDNLSINVDASTNFAGDGTADNIGAFATNWGDYEAGSAVTVSQETSVIYEGSASARAVISPATANVGMRNNLSITPAVNTQFLISFYARSTTTMTSALAVGFLPAGGNGAPSGSAACVDYNTQSLSANTWTKITCLLTTPGSGISNPDLVIYQTDSAARTIYVDALSITLNTNNSSNVQIGGGNKGGPTTLFTLDRSNGAPIADNNDAYLGSMYYDTSTGRIQCYEADGWGACGAAPDNIVNLNPEYAGAVLNGSGVGTMTADFCSNDTALSVNSSLCSSGQAKNFYRWTSPQATQQTYSIYVTYQLPATFNGFSSDDTVQLTARVDSTTNAAVTYEMFKSTGSAVTQCGSGETNVITGGGGSANTWYTYGINGNEATGCSFNSSSASNFVIFKINLKANSGANAYVSTLSFTTTGR